MAYSSGILHYRIFIWKKKDAAQLKFGETTQYEPIATCKADKHFNKGAKSLREGMLDAYNTVLFRMRYNKHITRECIIECDGVFYQITSLNSDYHANETQLTCTEMVGTKFERPVSSSAIIGPATPKQEIGS